MTTFSPVSMSAETNASCHRRECWCQQFIESAGWRLTSTKRTEAETHLFLQFFFVRLWIGARTCELLLAACRVWLNFSFLPPLHSVDSVLCVFFTSQCVSVPSCRINGVLVRSRISDMKSRVQIREGSFYQGYLTFQFRSSHTPYLSCSAHWREKLTAIFFLFFFFLFLSWLLLLFLLFFLIIMCSL